jgi:hypothetical protein
MRWRVTTSGFQHDRQICKREDVIPHRGQFVETDDGERIYGVFVIPEELTGFSERAQIAPSSL